MGFKGYLQRVMGNVRQSVTDQFLKAHRGINLYTMLPPEMTMDALSEQTEELRIFKNGISNDLSSWQKLRRVNRNWDGGLTIATIILTLTTTIIGVEGLKLDDGARKLWIGVCGGLVVAIQSIGNAFPVKQRAGSYRLLYAQGLALKSKAGYLQTPEEILASLPQMREEYYKLLVEASKIEA